MYLRDRIYGIHVLGEGVLKEACICPADNVAVVGVELYVDDLLVVGAGDGDSGVEFDFDPGVHSGDYGVCVGVFH